jgi:hypothetical protein
VSAAGLSAGERLPWRAGPGPRNRWVELFGLLPMKERLPLYLVLVGTATLVTGIIITVSLLMHRENCDGVSDPTVCQGYTNSIHWTYPIILIGATCFIAAGLSATNLLQRHRRKGLPVSPASRDDRERCSD